jgi:hypothetical protein
MSNKQKHKKWRKEFNMSCLERDNHKCKFCNVTENLDVHHITDRHDMPNGGYVMTNGITLCNEHHLMCEQYHKSGGFAKEGYHPNDLYLIIGSSYDVAFKESLELR